MANADRGTSDVVHTVRGTGEPILFIHGGIIAGPPEQFLTQQVLSDFKLVTYLRRGYPGSAPEMGPPDDYVERHAADAAALLRELGITDAHVVGHSSGGTIALQLAMDFPELVGSLVLLEPAIPALVQSAVSAPSDGPVPRLGALLQAGDFVAAMDEFMRTEAGMPTWREQFSRDEVRQADAYAPTFFLYEFPAIGAWRPEQSGPIAPELPVLYVSGERSPVPGSYAEVVSAWFPDTARVVISGVSHELYAEDPELVAEAIAAFLRRR